MLVLMLMITLTHMLMIMPMPMRMRRSTSVLGEMRKKAYRMLLKSLKPLQGVDTDDLADEIEIAVYEACDAGQEYNSKVRRLAHNLNANEALRGRLASNDLAPQQLVGASSPVHVRVHVHVHMWM